MDWLFPQVLWLIIPALLLLIWFDARSTHPMSAARRRLLLILRALGVLLLLLALASPARQVLSDSQAVILALDYSQSLGEEGSARVAAAADFLEERLDSVNSLGKVALGAEPRLLKDPIGPQAEDNPIQQRLSLMESIGGSTRLDRGLELARGLFPAGAARHVILLSDGLETEGSLRRAAEEAALSGIRIHTLGMAGDVRPDVRINRLTSSRSRLDEGASLALTAEVSGSLSGAARLRLFENGVEVDAADLDVVAGETTQHIFERTPSQRNLYNYRVVIEGFEGRDAIPANNEALAIVDVRGKPLWLYIEGEEGQGRYLVSAMEREGIRLDLRGPSGVPDSLRDLAGFDGVILSDVPAHALGESKMTVIRDYVERLGGGFVMTGGVNSFGVGGYYRTPIEEVLPVKLKAPDQEEQQSSALALVIDRSGSMAGQKLDICKSAAIATAELLTSRDYIGVYAFDSQVHEVVTMTKVTSTSAIANQISLLGSGGGTNIYPGMERAREQLNSVKAKIRHMIVLTDGQTSGQGYQALASQCNAEGITISTVAVGSGAQVGLLQAIAAAGGGQSYITMDPSAITRIFTQDTLVHTGRMIREEAFAPEFAESHPMLKDWDPDLAPPLLGYVKTNRKATAQIPLVTDQEDPLLAHWRFGLGKVTAFTSDVKSRWAALWVQDWDGYSRLWSQILRETARAPEGLNIDLRLTDEGEDIVLAVDLAEDAGTRRNGAEVTADIFHVPSHSLGSSMLEVASLSLGQTGPGWYETAFQPRDPGVYLVRARAGAAVVSAGHVHQPSTEVALGQIDETLLREVAEITGGTYLENPEDELTLDGRAVERYEEWWPFLLIAFLGVFLIDLLVRRWENALGVIDQLLSR
ncbi:MAG: VWA domain-containing protein [Verrucomicrobiota bacterium]